MSMRQLLPRLLATVTRQPRYLPTIEWQTKMLVSNVFRAWEWVFWKRGVFNPDGSVSAIIQPESVKVVYENEDGTIVESCRFYTVEAFLCFVEGTIRRFLTVPDFGFRIVRTPQLAFSGVQGMPQIPHIFDFAIAFLKPATITAGGFASGSAAS